MLTGIELGRAIESAIQLKLDRGAARSKAEIARYFGVKPPSVSDWEKKGSISKDKLPALWRYFSDVAGPSHWGMAASEWPLGLSDQQQDGAESEPPKARVAVVHTEVAEKSTADFDLLDVRAACGPGIRNGDQPALLSMVSMPMDAAQRMLGTTNRAGAVKIVMAAKDSMVPTINPDDLLFVDTSIIEYVSEGVYLLVHDGELVCKRLSRPGGDVLVTSDNSHYPAWKWIDRPMDTHIVGRVLRALPIQFKNFGGG